MHKKWMILAGCFLGGILICGLGTGVSFVEFSKLTYAGEREIGVPEQTTMTYKAEEGIDVFCVAADSPSYGVGLEMDESLPEGTIEIDVYYNGEIEKPRLYVGESFPFPMEADETDTAESDEADTAESSGTDAEDSEADGEDLPKDSETDEKNPEKTGKVLHVWRETDDMKAFMLCKDLALEDLKQGKIGSYGVPRDLDGEERDRTDRWVTVRYSSDLEGRVRYGIK